MEYPHVAGDFLWLSETKKIEKRKHGFRKQYVYTLWNFQKQIKKGLFGKRVSFNWVDIEYTFGEWDGDSKPIFSNKEELIKYFEKIEENKKREPIPLF